MQIDVLSNSMLSAKGGTGFINPWMDLASSYAPQTITSALELCEFLYVNDSTYREASEKIVDYFLTDVTFSGQSKDEKDKFEKIVKKDFGIMENLQALGYDFMCFSGDTKVVTEDGIFPIRSLTGKTVKVLSEGGKYRPAKFKSYGYRKLYRVSLPDGEQFYATKEHEWPVVDTNKKRRVVPTSELKNKGLFRVTAPRPPKNEDYFSGVRHGIVYGDGSIYNKDRKTPMAGAVLLSEGKRELLKFFKGEGSIKERQDGSIGILGLPSKLKNSLPENSSSASYWYGFVVGILSTDGSVNSRGDVVLTQKDKKLLERILEQLPRIGMIGGKILSTKPSSPWRSLPGGRRSEQITMNHLTLRRNFLQEKDFERKDQRERFLSRKTTDCGKVCWVKSVEETKIVDEVFCCVEMETHTFVVGNGVLTKQCYGNSFSTVSMPFTRVLACRQCKRETNIEHIDFSYSPEGGFSTYCPTCGSDRPHQAKDYKKKDGKKIKLIRWNPKKITLKANRLTHHIEFYTEVPDEIKAGIIAGDKFYLRTTPIPFLQAIRKQTKFKFKDGHIHHLKDPHLAGMWLGGWGLPSILSSFKNFFRLQVLRRYNEVLMTDYIVPLRIVSPTQGAYSDGNSIYNNLMSGWVQKMKEAVSRHRVDGTDWNFFPFPVTYQAVGGEGRALAPHDFIQDEENRMLNGRGIPPELFRSSMTLQAAPISLRVFERSWSSLVRGINAVAQDCVTKISSYMGSGDYECELESVKIIDDLENKAWRIQAMSAQLLSKQTAMGPMGIKDPTEEYKRILDEQKEEARLGQESQREMEMAQMGLINEQNPQGDAQGQGQGGGQQGGGGVTPEQLNQQADQIARQLLDPRMSDGDRRRQLTAIRQNNDTLHSLVIKKMDQLRTQARSIGQGQAMPQVLQQGGQQ